MTMTDEMRFKLETAIELIQNCLQGIKDAKIQSVYLSVASDYCRDVADVLKEQA
jgi:hypothetical protein